MWLVKWESAFNQWVNTSKVGNLFLSLSHYRTLVLALLLTHVITERSYGLRFVRQMRWLHDQMMPFDRRTTGKHGIRYPHIQILIFFKLSIESQSRTATVLCSASPTLHSAAQRCIKAVYWPYGFMWLFFGIFTAALLQLSVSLPQHQRSHKNALLQWTENSVRETFLHRSLQC